MLELDNVTLRGFASKHLNNESAYMYYRVRQLAGWPSITAEPDAHVGGPRPPLNQSNKCALSLAGYCAGQVLGLRCRW